MSLEHNTYQNERSSFPTIMSCRSSPLRKKKRFPINMSAAHCDYTKVKINFYFPCPSATKNKALPKGRALLVDIFHFASGEMGIGSSPPHPTLGLGKLHLLTYVGLLCNGCSLSCCSLRSLGSLSLYYCCILNCVGLLC